MTPFLQSSLALATFTTGLIAGFFYAFLCSVTLGTARLDDAQYIATMQAINATVRNPLFAASFFGALTTLAVAAVLHVRAGDAPRSWLVGLAFVSYVVGGFGLTLALNVPLNDGLAQVDLGGSPASLAAARLAYEAAWNGWNLVRTVCTTGAFGLLIIAWTQRTGARAATSTSARASAPHTAALVAR